MDTVINRLLLCILLLWTVSASSAEREYNHAGWQESVSDYIAELSWSPSSAIHVCFMQIPSEPLSIHLNAPYILREALEARLFLMDSPIAKESGRLLLQTLNQRQLQEQGVKEVVFTEGVDRLINQMAAGAWAVIELKARSGVVHTVELSSIGFYQSFERFNVLRNQLPPISWARAQKLTTYFASGSARLTQAQKLKLSDLVEYLQKDTSVKKITIDAHTDVEGDRLDNLNLSKQRAAAVKEFLVSAGVDESMLVAVRHHGERYPLQGARAWENRRVVSRLTRQ